jgi:PAS domain S-box-containing protein
MVRDPADVLRDPTRLAALRQTALLGTPPEEEFDRLARLAARLVGSPVAMVTLLDDERQFAKSVVGLSGEDAEALRDLPLSQSVCRHAVSGGRELVVSDARADPRTRGSAGVERFGFAAYLAVPLVTRDGLALGALCVAGHAPRDWTPDDVEALRDLAAVVTAAVEHRRAEGEARRAEETLLAAETMFRALVEQSLAGIYVVEEDRFTYVNPRFAEIFGRSREELAAGERVLELVAPEDRAGAAVRLLRLLRGEEGTFHARFRGVRAGGAVVHVEVHGTPAEIDGRPAVIGLLLDVTEGVRADAEREAALAARDRFYAMLSHELRTPLSAILLYGELLLSEVYGPVTEPQREALDRTQRSARHLMELINDLLDLSKLEAGKMERRVEDVELVEVVETVFHGVATLAREHGCEVSLRVAERPIPILGDARRIRQILLNLLSNAVKYGGGSPVEVRCFRTARESVVEVADQGPGIAGEDLPRIFEDFVQLGEGSAEGTGLGLPIARRLAELMGGRLEVESTPGQGSTFRLTLPLGGQEGMRAVRGR